MAEEQQRYSRIVVHTTRWGKTNKHRIKQERRNQGIVSSLLLISISKTDGSSHRRRKTRLEHQAISFSQLVCLLCLSFLTILLMLVQKMLVDIKQRKYSARTLFLMSDQSILYHAKPAPQSFLEVDTKNYIRIYKRDDIPPNIITPRETEPGGTEHSSPPLCTCLISKGLSALFP